MSESSPLCQLLEQHKMIQHLALSVVNKAVYGMYLWGGPGTGKSHIITSVLDEYRINYRVERGSLSGGGFFDLVEEFPDANHVLDDIGPMFKTELGRTYLMAALGNPLPGHDYRLMSNKKAGKPTRRVEFRGRIFAMSNSQLPPGALASRFCPIEYNPTEDQMKALMRYLAGKGWIHDEIGPELGTMTPAECLEVTEFIIKNAGQSKAGIDLRCIFERGFPYFIQDRMGMGKCTWQDTCIVMLKAKAGELKFAEPINHGKEKIQKERIIAKSIFLEFLDRPSRLMAWKDATGSNERQFDRRCKETACKEIIREPVETEEADDESELSVDC